MKEAFKKTAEFFKAHAPEIMENAGKTMSNQMKLLTYLQQECIMTGIYIPKKRPESQVEIDWLIECFRGKMEDAWKKQAEKENQEKLK